MSNSKLITKMLNCLNQTYFASKREKAMLDIIKEAVDVIYKQDKDMPIPTPNLREILLHMLANVDELEKGLTSSHRVEEITLKPQLEYIGKDFSLKINYTA